MATVKELAKKLDDLETRHLCAEKLIIGLIAELDKAQGRITSLEDLAADYVQDLETSIKNDELTTGEVIAALELMALIEKTFSL